MTNDIVARLRDTRESGYFVRKLLTEAADEIERLRAERDEARQRYCFAMAEHGEETEARQNAKDEGWDCFKEVKP